VFIPEEERNDRKYIYYTRTKTLIYTIVTPLPFIFGAVLTLFLTIKFILGEVYNSEVILSLTLGILNQWVGIIIGKLVFDDAQKKYLYVTLSTRSSYIWPILTPIIWLLACLIAWFLALPLYLMYKKRYQ
jgi:hypothetical protein